MQQGPIRGGPRTGRGCHITFKVVRFGGFPRPKLPCLETENVVFCPYKNIGLCDERNKMKELRGFALISTLLMETRTTQAVNCKPPEYLLMGKWEQTRSQI